MGLLPLRVRRRLGLALFASAMLHGWLLTELPQGPRAQTRPTSVLPVRIEQRDMAADGHTARAGGSGLAPFLTRLVPLPDPAPEPMAVPETAPVAEKRPGARPVIAKLEAKSPPAPLKERTHLPERGAAALAQPFDTTWYAAHDLDTYPRALAPIRLEPVRVEGQGARLLLWLRIDEFGQVVEVKAGESGAPDHLIEAARASLAAVRFTPARKDERAVKSRVLLSVSIAGE